MKQFFATWGFVIAAVLFLLAALIGLISDGELNVTLFILGVAFLVMGIVRSRDGGKPE